MATYEAATAVNLPAGEDLNGDAFESLTINSSGQVVKTTGATDVIVATLGEDPGVAIVAGDMVPVVITGGGGIVKMKAQAAITAGHIIIPTTTAGRVAGAANIAALIANQMGAGYALEAATAAGDIIPVLAMSVCGPTA